MIVEAARTFIRCSTSTYSERISSVRSHMNVGAAVHAASGAALGLSVGSPLNPEVPATRTDVSTTPLGGCFHRFVDNRQLRLSALTTIRFDGLGNLSLRHALEIDRTLLQRGAQLFPSAGALSAARQISSEFCERHSLVQFCQSPRNGIKMETGCSSRAPACTRTVSASPVANPGTSATARVNFDKYRVDAPSESFRYRATFALTSVLRLK